MGIVSYAQNFEDVLLNRVFGSLHYAFYVDIGAYHPTEDSVTKTFYDRGWDGINIEPGDIFDELAAARPRDINLRMAVYDHPGTINFVQHPGWYAGLSHVTTKEDPPVPAPSSQSAVETRTVACDTLQNILDAHASGRPIAFIKIDAEGAEHQIIRSTDWRTIRPLVVLVEATKPRSNVLDNQSWEPILLEQGYLRAYFDGINCFYVPEERADLLRHFEIPVNILDGFQRNDPQLAAARQQVEAGKEPLKAAELKIKELTNDLGRARDEAARVAVIDEELQNTRGELASVRERLDLLHAGQNAAVAAVVEANSYQIAALRRQSAERLSEVERLRQELDGLAGIGHQAASLRRLVRELRWPDGPRALQAVLPLARVLRRFAQTRVPPPDPAVAALTMEDAAPVSMAAPINALPRRPLARRALGSLYAPLRPAARPLAWRMRAFLGANIHAEIGQLDHKLNQIRQQLAQSSVSPPAASPDLTALKADIQQFGSMLESTLLTLAIGNLDHAKEE